VVRATASPRATAACKAGPGAPPTKRSGDAEVTVALEELDAELVLEPARLAGGPGLGDPQPLGRAREAALLRDRDEVPQMPEFH